MRLRTLALKVDSGLYLIEKMAGGAAVGKIFSVGALSTMRIGYGLCDALLFINIMGSFVPPSLDLFYPRNRTFTIGD